MDKYLVKTPGWLRRALSKRLIWNMPATGTPTVYLTFDDGPHPTITPFVLKQLAEYDAKATFFCVGNNVSLYPGIYAQVLAAEHTTGNHTYDHINGWKTAIEPYLDNINKAKQLIDSQLFRPPYGRISPAQIKRLAASGGGWKICMWSVLSADFDTNKSPQQCIDNVLKNIAPGSIVVFHDSEKAWDRLSVALPAVLAYCRQQGWAMAAIPH
jgi:peptidoglycan/xylan/chitin deacetylase (PgdA/CDA1 family)